MCGMEIQIKGWPAAVLLVALLLGGITYMFFIPGSLREGERRVIVQELRDEHLRDLSSTLQALSKNPGSKAHQRLAITEGNQYLADIKIVKTTVPPRGFSFSKRVRIEFTVNGKAPGDPIRYYRLFRYGDGKTDFRIVDLTKDEFESFW